MIFPARACLDCIEPVVIHIHTQKNSAARSSTQIFDDDILIDKGAATQLGEFQALGFSAIYRQSRERGTQTD